jgi:cytochrome c oxidase subunit 3/cytochrome o ubiquinol oxidase subunit 3
MSEESDTWTLPSRGRAGMVCLIITEVAFFAIFVVAYLFYVGKSVSGPTPAEVLHTPVLASILLLSSSWTIVLAMRALRADATGRFARWWFVTLLLGASFLALTAREWARLIGHDGLTIATNLFGTTFYTLVGLHALHVTVGLTIIALVLALTLRGHVDVRHAERTEMLSWYWHFVDGVWVIVFLTVYVVGR